MEATVQKLQPERRGRPSVIGYVDVITAGRVYGWAWDPERPQARIAIRFEAGGETVAAVMADLPREDLKDSRIGDGAHAFEAVLPENIEPTQMRILAVCPESSETVELAPRAAAPAASANGTEDIREVVQTLCRSHHAIHANLRSVAVSIEEIRREAANEKTASKASEQSAVKERGSLASRLESMESAMLRVDGLLRDQAAKLEPLARRRADWVARLFAGLAMLLAGAALALALLR